MVLKSKLNSQTMYLTPYICSIQGGKNCLFASQEGIEVFPMKSHSRGFGAKGILCSNHVILFDIIIRYPKLRAVVQEIDGLFYCFFIFFFVMDLFDNSCYHSMTSR